MVDVLQSAPMVRPGPQRRRVSGLHLRQAREAAGYSREHMAALLDTRLATISDRENARDVSWDTWLSWAMALGLSLADAQRAPAAGPDLKPAS
jgi:DNA-binding XRE family transcriptional regulator